MTVNTSSDPAYALDARSQLIRWEYKTLREELHNLKNCQVTFLTFSVTATGLVLGVIGRFSPDITQYTGLLFLVPLVILLPSWWVFFDKAVSIARIVGYMRILEYLILHPQVPASGFCGWENALGLFRDARNSKPHRVDPYSPKGLQWVGLFLRLFTFRTTQRYLVLGYYAFSSLSILCILLSTVSGFCIQNRQGNAIPAVNTLLYMFLIVGGLVLFLSAIWNMWILGHLVKGKHSYRSTHELWKTLLYDEVSQGQHPDKYR